MKIVIRAPLLSISGYGQHSRQVFEAVKKITGADVSTQIVQWGNTSWNIDIDAENGQVGEIMRLSTDKQKDFDVSIQVQLPDEWTTELAKINIGVTAAVETDICNKSWIDSCNKMSAIVVPSKFTKGVLTRTGEVLVPIHVIPEWFIPEVQNSQNSIDIPLRTNFNFLIVSQLTAIDSDIDRKNVMNTIRWICETFKDDKDVGIVIKTNSGRGTALDKMVTSQAIKSIVAGARGNSKIPVYFVHGNMTNSEISAMYRHPKIKALVSLTRGEGFGLPLLEAAASGLPVIATDWSAHTEFLNLGKWIKTEYKLVEIPERRVDNRIFVKGSKWADPTEDTFKRKIKKFRESSEIPKQWANDLAQLCIDNFSRESIMKKYESFFKEILVND